MKISKTQFISQMEAQINEQIAFVNELKSLSDHELSARSSADSWNVLQIVEHMHLTMKLYTDQFEAKSFDRGSEDYVSINWKGRFFAEGMRPKENKIRYKMKTTNVFRPQAQDSAFTLFDGTITVMSDFIEQGKTSIWQGHKVVSALGPLVKFQIAEAVNFLLAHNERHIQQIKNVLNTA